MYLKSSSIGEPTFCSWTLGIMTVTAQVRGIAMRVATLRNAGSTFDLLVKGIGM